MVAEPVSAVASLDVKAEAWRGGAHPSWKLMPSQCVLGLKRGY